MPPVGQSNVLLVAQIRWCFRENIRLDVRKALVDNNFEVAAFNRNIEDYNQRCGRYRYRKGTLERARREVEKLRYQIESDARLEFGRPLSQGAAGIPSISSGIQSFAPSGSTGYGNSLSEELVQEVQLLLNELGYAPGPVDGKVGARTTAAVKSFQRENWKIINGKIDENLLQALKKARLERSGG